MRIGIIGTGYVGLVSGACLAEIGHQVVCIDNDPSKIRMLNEGRIPIYEPGLGSLVNSNKINGRISFSNEMTNSVNNVDAIFIAVGTPSRETDGHADLSNVYAVAREIGLNAPKDTIVIIKSTVPIGTGDEVEYIFNNNNRKDLAVVSNPEFLREGAAIDDFLNPDRIIIGSNDDRSTFIVQEIYKPLTDKGAPLVIMSRRSSELTKYAANAFLATKITFINEIADLCEKSGADVRSISKGIGLDDRIGSKFLQAGPGYGGSCFPKDTLALLKSSEDFHVPQRIIETVVSVNEYRKRAMGRKILEALGERSRGKVVSLLGLTFKPNTDDMRAAPSIAIARTLLDAGVIVRGCDPEGLEQARDLMHDVIYFDDPYDSLIGADAFAVVTEWESYRQLDLSRARSLMKGDVLVDLRNVYERDDAEAAGFVYIGLGR